MCIFTSNVRINIPAFKAISTLIAASSLAINVLGVHISLAGLYASAIDCA